MSLRMVINPNLIDMEYAVRGPIPQRAAEMKKQGRRTIPCNIGNPQALGQRPISFYRQVLSLLEGLGSVPRRQVARQLKALGPADRRQLSRLGVTLGRRAVFLPGLLGPDAHVDEAGDGGG